MNTERFPRHFRLKQRRLIRALFDRSRDDVQTTAHGVVRAVYRVVPRSELKRESPVQVGFSPGGHVNKAVHRNRVKRLLREVYRRHQSDLLDLFAERPDSLTMMLIYRDDLEGASEKIHRDLPELLAKVRLNLANTILCS